MAEGQAEWVNPFTQTLLPHEERMITEAKELRERLVKLETFITDGRGKGLSVVDRALMQRQAQLMADYLSMLHQRIGRFITK